MAQNSKNTMIFKGVDVRSWLRANGGMAPMMEYWGWETGVLCLEGDLPMWQCEGTDTWGAITGPGSENVVKAIRYLMEQVEAMERLRAALPELKSCEGIEVHTMDSLMSKLTGGQDWQDEKGAPEVDEVALMAEAREEGKAWAAMTLFERIARALDMTVDGRGLGERELRVIRLVNAAEDLEQALNQTLEALLVCDARVVHKAQALAAVDAARAALAKAGRRVGWWDGQDID